MTCRQGIFTYFIGGTGNSSNARLHLGYETTTTPSFRHYGNDFNATNAVSSYSAPIPILHTFWFNALYASDPRRYYDNGIYKTLTAVGSASAQALSSYAGSTIGQKGDGWFYNGDIGEIIIFNRALNDVERSGIESYLKTKWGIR